MAFTIKQNDTSPAIQATLQDYLGTAINLTGASVRFHMKNLDNLTVLNKPMAIISAINGTIRYNWEPVDTSVFGTYYAEIEVTYSDLTIETFPNNGSISIIIIPELA